MSVESQNVYDPTDSAVRGACPGVELVIEPRRRDLGDGLTVGRVLPFAKRRMVGPFIFFDVMGPVAFAPGKGIDVRPHPHIGLATVTYLFDGEIQHRDSLGFDQAIRPGDFNWMTAGRGIAHSERTDAAVRARGHRLHGIQSWVALPDGAEETAPEFHHHPKATLPEIRADGARLRLIAGRAFEKASPVKIFSDMFYVGVEAETGARITLPTGHKERALFLVGGRLSVNGAPIAAGRMFVFADGVVPDIRAVEPSTAMLLGGAPIGARLIWWNYVASSEERLEKARNDWRQSAERSFKGTPFALPPGESEFIPLPQS